ncbi:MAG: DUF817 domain-containing protein, partial [Nevskiaceae bacterium]|nr:DUF817 domain-containing protein [Nevskiaceae bacterium]
MKLRDHASANWGALRPFIAAEYRIGRRMARRRSTAFAYEFLRFGIKQAWACLFGGIMVALIIGTHLWYPSSAALARYDFLFLAALAVQVLLLVLRMETLEEAKVILVYHVVGTAMEIFKTSVGSWIYPEASVFHIGGVPLFTGFMYACIGSYFCRAWWLFHFQFTHHPPVWALVLLSIAIYVNFFLHHYVLDVRYVLFIAAALLFGRTRVYFINWRARRWMPLLLGLFLVSLFIWFAENVGTFTKTWLYPNQKDGWHLVSLAKLGSWFLLLIISYTLVALIKRPQALA